MPGAHDPGQHSQIVDEAKANQPVGNGIERRDDIEQRRHDGQQRLPADLPVLALEPGQAKGAQQLQVIPEYGEALPLRGALVRSACNSSGSRPSRRKRAASGR